MQFGVYIHFPYCLSKCPYCDFASRAEAVIPQQRYTDSVVRELRVRAAQFPDRKAISIYFGGGTPSLWDPTQFGRVLREIRSLWSVEPEAEVTGADHGSGISREHRGDGRRAGRPRSQEQHHGACTGRRSFGNCNFCSVKLMLSTVGKFV